MGPAFNVYILAQSEPDVNVGSALCLLD